MLQLYFHVVVNNVVRDAGHINTHAQDAFRSAAVRVSAALAAVAAAASLEGVGGDDAEGDEESSEDSKGVHRRERGLEV
jgi:hypothetical protein